jgi:hypothetical protein
MKTVEAVQPQAIALAQTIIRVAALVGILVAAMIQMMLSRKPIHRMVLAKTVTYVLTMSYAIIANLIFVRILRQV